MRIEKYDMLRAWERGLGIILGFCLVLLLHTAQAALQAPQAQVVPPPQPILNAPSLRIPAAPGYRTSLKELGYANAEAFLQQPGLQVQRASTLWRSMRRGFWLQAPMTARSSSGMSKAAL
ncbi:Uncharacterised protein [Candidatus Venteria ishoeyi]|uniref:Uncharacterized protein n=1 Tax=Candidatus Venteria ishoeyi TaxID=1899563 RepID=A0A1H6FA70_9GAMM|nr:Uncharacterised protein [Candidatus Venteria ishoeyi]